MTNNGIILIAKNNFYKIEISKLKNRGYLTLTDYWNNPSDFSEFINDIKLSSKKLVSGFTFLVNLTQYTGTSMELINLHIDAQKILVNAGLSRVAEVFAGNPLILKLFAESYSKESGAIKMTFENIQIADKWLDYYYSPLLTK
jgi:hypothetical protein